MSISAIQSDGRLATIFDNTSDTSDTSDPNNRSIDLTNSVNALSQVNVLDQTTQLTRTDPVGAASDACMGTCKLIGAATGGVVGAALGNAPGAIAGVGLGYTAGDIVGEFICDPNFYIDRSSGVDVHPDAPDGGAPPATGGMDTTVGGDATGGLSLTNGGVESNAGTTDTGGNVSVDTSGTQPPTSSGTEDNSSGASGTDNSNSSNGTNSSSDADTGLVGGSNGEGDMPADDGLGGGNPVDPRARVFSPGQTSLDTLSSLTVALGGNSGLSTTSLGLGLRA